MKKIFYLMASVAVLSLCLNSCKEKNKPEPTPEPTPEPEPVVVPTISLELNGADYSTIVFGVEPSDTLKPWVVTYYTQSEIAGKTDAQIQAIILAEIKDVADYYGEETYESFLNTGAGYGYFQYLTPGTDYVIVANYMDSLGNFTGAVAKLNASTLAATPPTGEEVELGDLVATYLDDYRDYDGSWTIYFDNDDESIEVALNIYSDEFGGTFGASDFDPDYSSVFTDELGGKVGLQNIAVTSNVTTDGKTANFAGNVIAYNGIKYIFTATADLAELLGEGGGGDDDDDAGIAPRRATKKDAAPKKMAQRK